MSVIEERVVQMKFDNKQFEEGIARTRDSLGRFTKQLQMDGATKGLEEVSAASKKLSLKNIEEGVQKVSDKFRALSVVGITALMNITNKAVDAGQRLVSSFTTEPLMSGFREYETNMNSIQTIMANTGLEGKKGLAKVTGALDELNLYADQTIYNFSEMARNIGTFTAAGVDLKTSTAAIKGIANLAAVSGSNAEQASTAMYQMSQAISSGTVTLEDWNSVVNAGMGGKVFQDALIETAKVHGKNVDGMIKKEGSFRLTLQEGWLTGDILTETLSKFTGDLSKKQLKQMGYTEDQIKGIMKMGKTASDAATKVKTMTQLIDTLQEAAGSGWTQTWQMIFGDFDEAKAMFTDVANVLGGFIDASSDARNKVVGDWKELGGRTVLIEAISNAFHALVAVIKPIGQAFRQIFPATTGKQLYDMTVALRDFTKGLMIGGETADRLKRTFAGVFAIFGIGWEIVKQVAKTLFGLFGEVGKGSGGFLKATASVGDFLVALHKAVKEGNGLTKFFSGLGKILAVPIKLIKIIATYIGSLFDDFDGDAAASKITGLTKKLEPLGKMGEIIVSIWARVTSAFDKAWASIRPIGEKISEFFGSFGSGIAEMVKDLDFGDVFAGINTGVFAGLFLLIRNLIKGEGGIGGFFEGISEAFEGITKSLTAMQNTLRAATLLQIALAVGVLALSMNLLSKIDGDGLKRGSVAIGALLSELVGAMYLFEKFSSFSGATKMPLIAAGLITLGIAINILVLAVRQLADMDWEELGKGMGGVTVLLALLIGTVKLMPNPSGMISTSVGLVILAGAIKLLVSSVSDLSGFSWKELAKGISGVAALLASLALFTKFSDANKAGLLQGAGIVLLAAGIKILVSAVKDFSQMSWKEIGKGLAATAGGLAAIGAALYLIPPSSVLSAAGVLIVAASLGLIGDAVKSMSKMSWKEIGKGLAVMAGSLVLISAALALLPPTSLLSAAAIFVVAASLGMISDALKSMATMSWGEIAKGLVVLAGSLAIIAAAMILMVGALPGAAALLVVAASLAILAPVLLAFGDMSWGEIAKSMVMLAGVFIVFGAAALLLTPVIPVMIALGAAVLLLGVGMLAAGVGVLAFAAGLTALAAAGAAGTAAIVGIVGGLVALIPMVMKQIGLGLIAFAEVIGTAGPAVTKAIVTLLNALIDAIVKLTPKIVNSLLKMLVQLQNSLANYIPKLVDAGMRMITGILDGIAKNIGKVIDSATKVAVNFINGISRNLPKVIDAGIKMIISFVNGLADGIRDNTPAMQAAGKNLASAIIDGMVGGLMGGVGKIVSAAKNVASSALSSAKGVLGIHSPSKEFEKIGKYVIEGFRKGLDGNKDKIYSAFNDLKSKLSDLKKSSAKDIDSLEAKLKKLTSARKKDNAAIKKTTADLKQARKENKAATAAYTELTKKLNNKKTALGKLANEYDKYTEKVKNAQQVLNDAIKTRDDYNASVREQYSDMPSATGETKLSDYIEDLKKQVEDTKVFSNAVQRLRKLGLNDEMYKDLIATGSSAMPFVEQLLEGGKTSVDEINKLNKELDAAGSALGKTASSNLYQAAVDSAKGIVVGLQKEQANIEKQMDKIADAMVKSIKKKLGIKSPSRVFAEVGKYSAEGLAQGMGDMSGLVKKSAAGLGQETADALTKALTNVADMVEQDVDMKPVITPVLDLSSVQKEASRIGGMLGGRSIAVDDAYSKAKMLSSSYMNSRAAESLNADQIRGESITYIQNNNSPKALSASEIYRQTKSQLARKKGALEK